MMATAIATHAIAQGNSQIDTSELDFEALAGAEDILLMAEMAHIATIEGDLILELAFPYFFNHVAVGLPSLTVGLRGERSAGWYGMEATHRDAYGALETALLKPVFESRRASPAIYAFSSSGMTLKNLFRNQRGTFEALSRLCGKLSPDVIRYLATKEKSDVRAHRGFEMRHRGINVLSDDRKSMDAIPVYSRSVGMIALGPYTAVDGSSRVRGTQLPKRYVALVHLVAHELVSPLREFYEKNARFADAEWFVASSRRPITAPFLRVPNTARNVEKLLACSHRSTQTVAPHLGVVTGRRRAYPVGLCHNVRALKFLGHGDR